MTREQAIVEFGRLVVDHVRADKCERNRANATEIMKSLAKCLAEQPQEKEQPIVGVL
jgi:hypothetical protein